MTTTPPEDRLDRIERILERLTERQARFDVQLEQLGEKVDRITTELGEKIDRLSANVDRLTDELDQEAQATAQRSLEVDARFLQLERRMNQFVQNSEQDRNQAAIDRAEFRSTVEQLLRVLTQQINGSNGGQEP